jgi:hypothetical protein
MWLMEQLKFASGKINSVSPEGLSDASSILTTSERNVFSKGNKENSSSKCKSLRVQEAIKAINQEQHQEKYW